MAKAQDGAPKGTREALIEAAAEGFNREGFDGINSNGIARAAGFAPQTFYRHFKDKTEIFIEVYLRWEREERAALRAVDSEQPDRAAAEILLDHHRRWAVFRRSLRALTAQPGPVREARVAARLRQAKRLGGDDLAEGLAAVLEIEALCDAYADDLTEDFEVDRARWTRVIAARVRRAAGGAAG